MDKKEELIRLLSENLELPIKFFTSNDMIADEYAYTVRDDYSCEKKIIYYLNNGTIVEDYIDCFEYYSDFLCDSIEDIDKLSDKEFDEKVKQYIEDNVEKMEAIVIFCD